MNNTADLKEQSNDDEKSPFRETSQKKRGFRNLWHRLSRVGKILAVAFTLIFLFVFYISLDANKYRATVLVIEGAGKVGVNPTTERLDFGDLSPGGRAVRTVSIDNGTPLPMYLIALHFGAINDLMELDKNFFALSGNSNEKIEFSVYMPASAPIGKRLNGRVILFKIPGPWW